MPNLTTYIIVGRGEPKMLDMSKLNGDHIGTLAGAYMHAKFVFRIEPADASKKKQKRSESG